MPYLLRISNVHVSPQIPKIAIRGSYEAALRKGVTTALGFENDAHHTFKIILSKCAGVEIHSFRNHNMDHFVLELKSTLNIKIVESTLLGVILRITSFWSGNPPSKSWNPLLTE